MVKSYDRPENIGKEVSVVQDAGLGKGDGRDDHGQLHGPRVHHLDDVGEFHHHHHHHHQQQHYHVNKELTVSMAVSRVPWSYG